ncbi:hypothetical protein GmRootA79_25560 [Acidovorax sp. A79]
MVKIHKTRQGPARGRLPGRNGALYAAPCARPKGEDPSRWRVFAAGGRCAAMAGKNQIKMAIDAGLSII